MSQYGASHLTAESIEVIYVGGPGFLLFVIQPVETNILLCTCPGRIVEGITGPLTYRHFPPNGTLRSLRIVVDGHPVLKEFLFVLEYLFAHFSQVDVQISPLPITIVDEGIEQPKLYILNVCRLKVALIYLAHDPTPVVLGIGECTIGQECIGIEVVGATLLGIIRETESLQIAQVTLPIIAVGEELLHAHLSHIVVAKELGIIADITRR